MCVCLGSAWIDCGFKKKKSGLKIKFNKAEMELCPEAARRGTESRGHDSENDNMTVKMTT